MYDGLDKTRNEDLNTVLEIGCERNPAEQPTRRVTLFARLCQAFGLLSLFSGAICYIPSESDFGPLGSVSVLALLGSMALVLLIPLTLIAATVAALRIRVSKQRFRGVRQIWFGIGCALLGFAAACVWGKMEHGGW
jgi:hypothetical protein